MALVRDLEEYDCPYCMEKLLPPVFQCPNGHLFCEKCIRKYNPCPTCQSPTVRHNLAGGHIRNLEVERIIRDYQTHKCPWTGCLKRLKLENLESHKLGCIKRSGKFCSWLKFRKCKEERSLVELLGHLEAVHGGSGHFAQNALETVEFRDECPIKGNPNNRYSKIFACWIRGRDSNVNVFGDYECFPFILMVTYGRKSMYWTPFVIASTKALKENPFLCEMRFGFEFQAQDTIIRNVLQISRSPIHNLQDNKWSEDESFSSKYPHIRRIITEGKVEAKDGRLNQVQVDDEDDDEEKGGDESDGTSDSDDATVAGRANNQKGLPYSIMVSFRDAKTFTYYKFHAQKNYLISSHPGASSSSVSKLTVEPSKPGISTSTISKPACPK